MSRYTEFEFEPPKRGVASIGNFFNFSSPSFLGGSVGQTIAEVGLGVAGFPEISAAIGAASGYGQSGNIGGAITGGLRGYGAGELGSTGADFFSGAGAFTDTGGALADPTVGIGDFSSFAPTAVNTLSAGGGGDFMSAVNPWDAAAMGGSTGVTAGMPAGMDPTMWQRIKQLMMPGGGGGGGPNTLGFNMPTANLAMNALSSGYGMFNSNRMMNLAQGMNPMGPYQPGYAAQLNSLVSNPSSITGTPGYQFGLDQGSQAVQRAGAAQGYTGSGNMAIALNKFGQDYGQNFLSQQEAMLAGLSQGGNANQINAMNLANQSAGGALAGLGYGVNRFAGMPNA